ncbi:nitrous oxide reductase family maturation protein NosD [Brucella pseudogrignonensis]|uniref:Nitrous oxidase accessory protein n=1 Tax=Brucella pseudogrignonensis TaxID=419475 RepID=A0ABU1MFE9_9HYPH|nr:nitrous oxidase accessory protein [Brucella pseudogrignonensis]
MTIPRLPLSLCMTTILSLGFCSTVMAAKVDVAAGESVQAAINKAEPGDVVRLGKGTHKGAVVIDQHIELIGEPGAVIDGQGTGNAILVNAPDVVVRGIEVRGSGRNMSELNSGIFVARTATGARVENNRLIDNLYGIYLHGAANSIAQDNEVIGQRGVRMSQTGSGISIWNAPGAKIIGNTIRYGRDGIYTNASKNNVFQNNLMEDVRFAVHYMYTDRSEVIGNISRNNSVGFAIMYTNRLKVMNNISDGDRDHGLLLNYANSSAVSGNQVIGRMQAIDRWLDAGVQKAEHGLPNEDQQVARAGETMRLGPEKCVFIYNANKNKFTDNSFENCSIGIHFTAGSEGNTMTGNAFINNRNQVKYVGTRNLDWSHEGRGNYWSDNPAFDLNGDGIADNPYRPNDLIDQVLWTSPQAKILINSPAVQTIRWAQTQFPALLPGGVVDNHPLMKPPFIEANSDGRKPQ